MTTANILFVQADQHRFDSLGINGHPLIRTPHIDGLAHAGMNFTRAFCPSPVCTPTRTSLLTGLWPTQHGCIANAGTEAFRGPLPGLPTFSETLKEKGYYLGYVGKWSVDTERDPTCFGFEDYVAEKQYGAWRKAQGLAPRPWKNGWFGEVDEEIGPEASRLAWGADQTIHMLRKAGQRPFFITWNPGEPHLPNVVPQPYASLYPPEQVPPWPSFPDPLEGKPYIQRQQLRSWGLEGRRWEQWAPAVARYLGEISLLDAQLGRVLEALDALDLADHTLVIYTSDHGDLCGGHGMIDKHFVMYDDVVRVPLVARWPGQVAPGQTCPAFVSSALDLAYTFCEVGGAAAPAGFMGQSLLPLLRGQAGSSRPDIFSTYHGSQFGLYSQRMVRDERWKYVWNPTAEDELYDLVADPGEITNLAGRSGHAAELQQLRGRLIAWMEATDDKLLNSWTRQQLAEGRKA